MGVIDRGHWHPKSCYKRKIFPSVNVNFFWMESNSVRILQSRSDKKNRSLHGRFRTAMLSSNSSYTPSKTHALPPYICNMYTYTEVCHIIRIFFFFSVTSLCIWWSYCNIRDTRRFCKSLVMVTLLPCIRPPYAISFVSYNHFDDGILQRKLPAIA